MHCPRITSNAKGCSSGSQCLRAADLYWPHALRTGLVHSLAKRDGALEADAFRPIIIYSVWYRSWSTLRARAMLLHVQRLASDFQLGFMPGCEPGDLWLFLQALIEGDHLHGQGMLGYVTELRKAFETLPRLPIHKLAVLLGFPAPIVDLWHEFLTTTVKEKSVRP